MLAAHRSIWNIILKVVQPMSSRADNIFSIIQQQDSHQKQIFGVTMWSLWKHKNNSLE